MKKAVLVVSFGTSYAETRAVTLDAIEQDFKAAFPDCDVFSAYTSNIIRRKLKERDNLNIMSPFEALNYLQENNYDHVYVQSLHIINGYEFAKIKIALLRHKDNFKKLRVGNPLLTTHDDYFAVAKALKSKFPELAEDEAVVMMGHGTDHFANACYPALERVFRTMGDRNVYIGTVEGFPEIEHVMQELEHDKVKKVVLIPLMIVSGDHATNDLAGDDEDSWKFILEKAGYEVKLQLNGMGENEEIRQMFIKHVPRMYQ